MPLHYYLLQGLFPGVGLVTERARKLLWGLVCCRRSGSSGKYRDTSGPGGAGGSRHLASVAGAVGSAGGTAVNTSTGTGTSLGQYRSCLSAVPDEVFDAHLLLEVLFQASLVGELPVAGRASAKNC